MQLKGDALARLRQDQEAINIWKKLANSEHEETANKALQSITNVLSQKALQIHSTKSSQEALSVFIDEHLKINLTPKLNELIIPILMQSEPDTEAFSDPELAQHQFQLQFNTIVIQHLEAQLIKQKKSNNCAASQKPVAISKTGPKAG